MGFLILKINYCLPEVLEQPEGRNSHLTSWQYVTDVTQMLVNKDHSNMTLTFFHWTYMKRHRVKICDKSRYQRSACIIARLMTSHVNIHFCRRPLQNSPLENVATMSHFLSVSYYLVPPFLLPLSHDIKLMSECFSSRIMANVRKNVNTTCFENLNGRHIHERSCIIEFIKRVSPTSIINSIIQEHECKILFIIWH